jgi:hypothetical protein
LTENIPPQNNNYISRLIENFSRIRIPMPPASPYPNVIFPLTATIYQMSYQNHKLLQSSICSCRKETFGTTFRQVQQPAPNPEKQPDESINK